MYCLYRSFIVDPILLEPGRRGWAGRFNQWCYQSNWYVFWFSFFFLLVDGHYVGSSDDNQEGFNLLKINSPNRPQRLASSVKVPVPGLSSVYLVTRCREHWYPSWTDSIIKSTVPHCDWNDPTVGMAQELNAYVCIHLGLVRGWIIRLALNEQKQPNCRTDYMKNFNRDVRRDKSGIDDRDFVEERRVGQPSLFTILIT